MTSDNNNMNNLNYQNIGNFIKPSHVQKRIIPRNDGRNMIKVPNSQQFVYITPDQFSRKNHINNLNTRNVFKIPSQRVLIENINFNFE